MTGRGSIKRITVALDGSPLSLAALEEAVELAARLGAVLTAVCVEDVNLTRLSCHPHALAYCISTASHLPLDEKLIERSMHMQANKARRTVAEYAGRHGIETEFSLRQGKVAEQVVEAALEADLLILGWTAKSRGKPRIQGRPLGSTASQVIDLATRPVLILQDRVQDTEPVIALFDGSPGSEKALKAAAHLEAMPDGVIAVFLLADSEEEAERLQERAEEILRAGRRAGRYQALPRCTPQRLSNSVSMVPGGVLVLSADLPMLRDALLREVLATLSCSVLLVR